MAPIVHEEIIPNSAPPNGGTPKKLVTYEVTLDSKYNPEDYNTALNLIANGSTVEQAAKAINIGRRTLFAWKDRDETATALWQQAREAQASSWLDVAGNSGLKLADTDNLLALEDPKIASAWVQSHAQAARTLIEVAKRLAPRLYGDRIEHTGSQTQVAFVVSVAPTATVQAQLEGPATDTQAITIQPLERSAPRRPGRQGKVKVRQETKPPKQRRSSKRITNP